MRCISQYVENARHAGPKAKKDIEKILNENYNCKNYVIYDYDSNNIFNRTKKIINQVIYLLLYSKTKELTVIQYPISNRKIFVKDLKNKVLMIHDINGLRNMIQNQLKEEIKNFNTFNCIIAHNETMKKFLVDNGVSTEIYVLEMFDYLCECDKKELTNDFEYPTIIYSGNLGKSPFVYELQESKMKFNLNLYGIEYKNTNNKKIKYNGSFKPDELPNILKGNLGLVWDGKLDDSDADEPLKNYTKYNNPHKLSCYLAAGIPVIVWEKSAVAKFVKKFDIGYCINNLYDINNLNFKDYCEKVKNIKIISENVKKGFYTKNVFDKIIKKIEK